MWTNIILLLKHSIIDACSETWELGTNVMSTLIEEHSLLTNQILIDRKIVQYFLMEKDIY